MEPKNISFENELPEKFVDRIKQIITRNSEHHPVKFPEGFASLYKMDEDRFLAAVADSVGTKVKLAIETGIHKTIGIDLVALCVNDLICTGAKPLFFMDNFSGGKLNHEVSEKVIDGIAEGCSQAKLEFLGGQTAEMPGIFHHGDYDLSGFLVGEVKKEDMLDGNHISHRDTLIGIASSGFHTNGFSLIRKVIEQEINESHRRQMKIDCLTPTKIYAEPIRVLRAALGKKLTGLANITGSGLLNISRISDHFDYDLSFLPSPNDLPSFMVEVMERTGLNKHDLCHTFNMGIGMVLTTNDPDAALQVLTERNEKVWVLGQVTKGSGKVHIK